MVLWVGAAIFAIWFLRGVWVATARPRLQVVTHHKLASGGRLLTVRRQQLLPPWLVKEETWMLLHNPCGGYDFTATRGDGVVVQWDRHLSALPWSLCRSLHAACDVAEARAAETEELSK
jgi:hypothetical protein